MLRISALIVLSATLSGCSGIGVPAGTAQHAAALRRSSETNRLYYVTLGSELQQRRLSGGDGKNANYTGQAFGQPAVDTSGEAYALYDDPSGQRTVVVFDQTLQKVQRTLSLTFPAVALALDPENQIYVGGNNLIEVFAAGASGTAPPERVLTGGVPTVSALAADAAGRIFAAGNGGPGTGTIVFFPANGEQHREKSIGGSQTGIVYPQSLALGADDNLYVVNQLGGSLYAAYDILVFPKSARGNVAPLRMLQSPTYGASLALGTGGEMYLGPIPNQPNKGIAIYAPGASGNPDPTGFVGPPIADLNQIPLAMTLQYPWSDAR